MFKVFVKLYIVVYVIYCHNVKTLFPNKNIRLSLLNILLWLYYILCVYNFVTQSIVNPIKTRIYKIT